MAIVTTDVNVKFNSVLDDVVVLSESGTERTVVLWEILPPADQALLTKIINDFGGNAPLAGPVAGKASVNYHTIAGGGPTGLDPLAAATAGKATVNFDVSKSGSDASGLTVSGTATAGYQTVTITPAFADGAAATGLANDTTLYTATITVDGAAKSISVSGDAAQTVTTLLAEINTDLGASAVASLNGGNIRVTSATTGAASSVSIVDVDLFASLTGTAVIGTAVAGVAATNSSKNYTAQIEVDGAMFSVKFTGGAGTTLANVATEIDADLGAAASVAVTGGDLVITSATTGTDSRVRVYDTGWLFSSLTDFDVISYVDGDAPTVYTTTVMVDGVAVPVSVQGSDAQTFTTLVAAINTDLDTAATAAISGSAIVITSATTGAVSKVELVGDGLFTRTAGYTGVSTVPGAANLVDAFKVLRMGNGTTAIEYFPHKTYLKDRPANPIAGVVPKTINYIYWGGAGPDWRYFNDDSAV